MVILVASMKSQKLEPKVLRDLKSVEIQALRLGAVAPRVPLPLFLEDIRNGCHVRSRHCRGSEGIKFLVEECELLVSVRLVIYYENCYNGRCLAWLWKAVFCIQ